jgi:acetyltransferase-like isoleucine patch superfamily enzyme
MVTNKINQDSVNEPISFAQKCISKTEMKSPKNCLLHFIYLSFYAFFKYSAWPLSNYFRFAVIRCFAKRIKSTYIAEGVTIWFPWNVTLARDVSLNQGVIINGCGGVVIEKGTRIAAYVCINTADHQFQNRNKMIKDQGYIFAGVHIESDVWIGTGSVINKGVRIGKGSVIGSGSVVTKNIEPYSIAVGVPCRKIASR